MSSTILTFFLSWSPGLIFYYVCPVPQPLNLASFPPYFFEIDYALYRESYRYAMLDLWLEDHNESHTWSYTIGLRAGLAEWESLWPGVIRSDLAGIWEAEYVRSLEREPEDY